MSERTNVRRKWYRNRFGIEELDVSREFVPSNENYRAFDLRAYGIVTVSVIGRAVSQFPDAPSPWHVHRKHIELIYCQAGSCDYESLGKKYRLMPGLMFVSRPN